jgi:hypothetical protein
VGYEKLITKGNAGKRKITRTVTFSDGTETSKSDPVSSTEIEPTNEVYEVGAREKPKAYIDYIWESYKQGFWKFLRKEYDVSASGTPNSDLALLKNNKVIMLGKSNKEGMLNFNNVTIKTGDVLSVGTYTGGKWLWVMPKAKSISEPTVVDTKDMTVTSSYDKLHNQKSKRTDNSTVYEQCSQEVKDAYLASLSDIEKTLFNMDESTTIYYTEVPCEIANPDFKNT